MIHPMPASPLPWRCDNRWGLCDANGELVCDFEWMWREDAAQQDCSFAEWAANNAPKLAARVAQLEARSLPAGNGTDYIDHYKARVEALEAALRDIIDTPAHPMRRKLVDIARKALEAK